MNEIEAEKSGIFKAEPAGRIGQRHPAGQRRIAAAAGQEFNVRTKSTVNHQRIMPEQKSSLTFPDPLDAPAAAETKTTPPGVAEPERPNELARGSWVELVRSKFREAFFEKPENVAAWDAFVREENEKSELSRQFNYLREGVETRRVALDFLRQKLAVYVGCEVAKSIHEAFKSGSLPLEVIADTFPRVLVLKRHGAEILKLAETEFADLERDFKKFCSENSAALKKFALI